jgi:hypothetical protein
MSFDADLALAGSCQRSRRLAASATATPTINDAMTFTEIPQLTASPVTNGRSSSNYSQPKIDEATRRFDE